MKKYLSLILAVMLLLSVAVSPVFAVIGLSPDYRIKTAVWVGIANNGNTPTSGSAITSDNRVIGFRVTGSTTPAAGLYDESNGAGGASNAKLFDEAAAASNSESVTWYPAPKTLTNGLAVVNNASTTVTTVYYE